MNQRKGRHTQTDQSNAELTETHVPAPLVQSSATQKVESVADYYYAPPKNRWWRFLWKYSQPILSLLTLAILGYYAIQWAEFRGSRVVDNRAWVLASSATLEPDARNPDIQFLFVNITNTGRSPGVNGDIMAALERRPDSPPDDMPVNDPSHRPMKMVFGTDIPLKKLVGSQELHLEMPPHPAASVPIESTRKNVPTPTPKPTPTPAPSTASTVDSRLWYLYGTITYDDVFGHHHTTQFCFTNAIGTSTWWHCSTFNSAD